MKKIRVFDVLAQEWGHLVRRGEYDSTVWHYVVKFESGRVETYLPKGVRRGADKQSPLSLTEYNITTNEGRFTPVPFHRGKEEEDAFNLISKNEPDVVTDKERIMIFTEVYDFLFVIPPEYKEGFKRAMRNIKNIIKL